MIISSDQNAAARFVDCDPREVLPRRAVVLVPVDPAAISFAALQVGLDVARQMDGKLVLFHAMHLNLTPYGPANLANLKAALRKEAMQKLEPLIHYARAAGVPVMCDVEDGAQAEAILKAAKKLEADLIVLGPCRHGFFARLHSRRTREQVLRGVDCPVIVMEKD